MRNALKKILIIIVIFFVWDLIHIVFNINSAYVPSTSEMIVSLINNFNTIVVATAMTTYEALFGLFLAILISIGLSVLINEIEWLKRPFLDVISILQMIPLIAVAPLLIIWFGLGVFPKILLVVVYSTFPILIVSLKAFETIPKSYNLYMDTLSKNIIKKYFYLYFPLCSRQIFSGLKIAVTYSVVCAFTSEYIGGQIGLGILLNRAYSSYQTDLVFVIIIIVVSLTLFLLYVVDIVERKINK